MEVFEKKRSIGSVKYVILLIVGVLLLLIRMDSLSDIREEINSYKERVDNVVELLEDEDYLEAESDFSFLIKETQDYEEIEGFYRDFMIVANREFFLEEGDYYLDARPPRLDMDYILGVENDIGEDYHLDYHKKLSGDNTVFADAYERQHQEIKNGIVEDFWLRFVVFRQSGYKSTTGSKYIVIDDERREIIYKNARMNVSDIDIEGDHLKLSLYSPGYPNQVVLTVKVLEHSTHGEPEVIECQLWNSSGSSISPAEVFEHDWNYIHNDN